jgi:hypothetical protein
MEEIWKDVPNYEGLYQVSSIGNVKSLNRVVYRQGKFAVPLKGQEIKKVIKKTKGYYCVDLYKNGKGKQFEVQQLVAMAFLGHKPCGHILVVDHINDIKTDNRVENLQIVPIRYNACKTQGRYSSKYKGVNWDKGSNKWVARIEINRKSKYLGSFTDEYQAHLAYQKALSEIQKPTIN